MSKTVELLRSKYDGKTLAICVGGIRHGPDVGPWEIVWSKPLDTRVSRPSTAYRRLIAAARTVVGTIGPATGDECIEPLAKAIEEADKDYDSHV